MRCGVRGRRGTGCGYLLTGRKPRRGAGVERTQPLVERRPAARHAMKLLVTVDGKPGDLQFERSGTGCRFSYHRDGVESGELEASVVACEPGIFSILLGGRSYEAKVVAGPSGYYVDLRGHR